MRLDVFTRALFSTLEHCHICLSSHHIHIVCSGLEGIFMVNCHVWLYLNAYLSRVSFCCFAAAVAACFFSLGCCCWKTSGSNKLLRTEKCRAKEKIDEIYTQLRYRVPYFTSFIITKFLLFFVIVSFKIWKNYSNENKKSGATLHWKCDAIASFWLLFTQNVSVLQNISACPSSPLYCSFSFTWFVKWEISSVWFNLRNARIRTHRIAICTIWISIASDFVECK